LDYIRRAHYPFPHTSILPAAESPAWPQGRILARVGEALQMGCRLVLDFLLPSREAMFVLWEKFAWFPGCTRRRFVRGSSECGALVGCGSWILCRIGLNLL